jgi:hypothetical protein
MRGYFIVPLENKFNSIDFKIGHTYETNATNLFNNTTWKKGNYPFAIFETLDNALFYHIKDEYTSNFPCHIYTVSFSELNSYTFTDANTGTYFLTNEITIVNKINYNRLLQSKPAELLYQILYILNNRDDKADHLFAKVANELENGGYDNKAYQFQLNDCMAENALVALAKLNVKKYNDILVYSNKHNVQKYLVSLKNEDYLDILINSSVEAMVEIAKLGIEKYLDQLLKTCYVPVLQAIAETRIEKYLDILINDSDSRVVEAVAEFGSEKHLDKLVNYKPWSIRAAVARRDIEKYNRILVNDKDDTVKSYVAECNHPDLLDKLIRDKSSYVACKALESLTKYDADKVIAYLNEPNNKFITYKMKQRLSELNNDAINRLLIAENDYSINYNIIQASTDCDILTQFLANSDNNLRCRARNRLMKLKTEEFANG